MRPDAVAQPAGHLHQQLVGRRAAQHVIEALEVIEVQQQHVHRVRAAQGRGEPLVEERARWAAPSAGRRSDPGLELVVVLGERRGSGGAWSSGTGSSRGTRTGTGITTADIARPREGPALPAAVVPPEPLWLPSAVRRWPAPRIESATDGSGVGRSRAGPGGDQRTGDFDREYGAVGAAAGAGERGAGSAAAALPRPARTPWKSSREASASSRLWSAPRSCARE